MTLAEWTCLRPGTCRTLAPIGAKTQGIAAGHITPLDGSACRLLQARLTLAPHADRNGLDTLAVKLRSCKSLP
jgi:hypothetical protein